jgi:hypothetical protein
MQETRAPSLRRSQKISYGIGQVAEGIKNNSFESTRFWASPERSRALRWP